MGKWVIGKYIRLSQADRDLMIRENKAESESISHQKALIQNFISGDPELAGCEQYEFFDDGYSGTNFERPSFERLLEKIKGGTINCVIVKDFSRFGRDYIELGDYLERIFPFLGVRFISINDHYDSLDYKGTTGGLDVVMKNIVYDYYSKDRSVKVTTAKRAKMKRGEYIGGHVPFGLMKDPEDYHKLTVDPEAAPIVREIFEAAISGMRITDIARMLNEKGYETPARYYQRKHPEKNKFKNTSELDCWNHNSVRRTLKQEMYYGAVVGHRREGIGVGWKHSVAIPKDEQIIVEGKHPGIVTKEEFMEAQKIFRKRRETKQVTDKSYPLWKKVRCGTCGRAMPFKDRIIRGRPYRYFGCPHSQAQVGDGGCSKEYIREDVLNEVVWESIKVLLSTVGDAKKKVRQRQQEADRDNSRLVRKLAKLQKDREKCDAERFANVDQFMAGTLDKDVYQSRRADLTRRAERIDAEMAELEERLHEAEVVQDDGMQDALETLDKFSGATELDQKIVQALVDKVVVYDPRHVEIRWKFSDEVLKLLRE